MYKTINASPLEVCYTARFGEPFTTLKLKLSSDQKLKIGDYLQFGNENFGIWRGSVTQLSFSCKNSLPCEYSVTARSEGFELSQCEARPAVYEKPSFNDICAFHISPHKIKFLPSSAQCGGSFTVAKGISEWKTVQLFCGDVMGVRPYIDFSGNVHSGENLPENKIIFQSNIISLKLIENGESAVKSICYKPDGTADYNFYFNSQAENAVCGKSEFVNLSNLPSWQGQSRLNQILKDSQRGAKVLTVKTDEYPKGCQPGCKAEVQGVGGDYRVESVYLRRRGIKTECVCTLLPENIF